MKKQNTSAIVYLWNNFWGIAVFTAIPSLVLGFGSYAPFRADFLRVEFAGGITNESFMDQLTKSFFIYKLDYHILLIVIGAILAIFALSLLLVKTSRHMHLGVNSNENILRLGAEVFFKVLLFFTMFFVIAVLLDLLVIGMMYFVNMLKLGAWRGAVLILLYSLTDLLLSYLIALFSATLPMTVEEGYRLNVALSYSVRLMGNEGKKFVWQFAVGYLLSRIVIVSLCILVDLWYVRAIFCAVFYFVWMSLVVPLFCDSYITQSQGVRGDITQTLF